MACRPVAETILVTGGLGLNGSWCIRELLEHGYNVVAYDRANDRSLVADLDDDLPVVTGDLGDQAELSDALRRHQVDIVVHLAAMLSSDCERDPAQALRVNGLGTHALLEAASQAGVRRVVYSSSLSVYGPFGPPHAHPTYEPVNESHPRNPHARQRIYGMTKIVGEELGLAMSEAGGPSFVALRFSHILAPTRTARHSGLAAHQLILDGALEGRPVRISHGGDQRFDLVYVRDLARSVYRACVADGEVSGAFNIGSGRLIRLHDIADAIRVRIPAADIAIGPGLDFMDLGSIYPLYDLTKARTILGYEPAFDLNRAVEDYLANRTRTAAS